MEARKRVVLCSLGVPHAREGASQVVIFNFIASLRETNIELMHVLLIETGSEFGEDLENYKSAVVKNGFEVVPIVIPKLVIQGILKHGINLAGTEYALAHANAFGASLVIAFDILPAWFATNILAPRKMAWLGDLNFQTMFYHGLYELREHPWQIMRFIKYWLAAHNWRRVYADVLSKFDEVLLAAASSTEQLSALGLQNHSYHPYPWPANAHLVEKPSKPSIPTFMFFGNLVGLGSRSALHFMVSQVYRRMLTIWDPLGFQILIAGRGDLPNWFLAAVANKPEFVRLGFVEDLPSTLAKCHAVLVPIDVPVGNRTRILYALSQGALVIAHQNVALGNPALIDGETCALATDGEAFVERMKRSFDDPIWAEVTAEAGQKVYQDLFHPDSAGADFVSRVNRQLDQVTLQPTMHSKTFNK